MRLLIVIGAGGSYDPYPEGGTVNRNRIPLANILFEPGAVQNELLNKYQLMGLAAKLRRKKHLSDSFNVEKELEIINESSNQKHDQNELQALFKARFYLHGLINNFTIGVRKDMTSHSCYVDLISQLKDWISEDENDRFVDIVSFNYDDLLEEAMGNVYSFDWSSKSTNDPLAAYYSGKNLKIFKPHGSINWGRTTWHRYKSPNDIFKEFNSVSLGDRFEFIKPADVHSETVAKSFIPAIAIPFGKKTNFDECPSEMYREMERAISEADKIITIGWRGADAHFTSLLKQSNQRHPDIYIVSPRGDSELGSVMAGSNIKKIKEGFSEFVSVSQDFEKLLDDLNTLLPNPVLI